MSPTPTETANDGVAHKTNAVGRLNQSARLSLKASDLSNGNAAGRMANPPRKEVRAKLCGKLCIVGLAASILPTDHSPQWLVSRASNNCKAPPWLDTPMAANWRRRQSLAGLTHGDLGGVPNLFDILLDAAVWRAKPLDRRSPDRDNLTGFLHDDRLHVGRAQVKSKVHDLHLAIIGVEEMGGDFQSRPCITEADRVVMRAPRLCVCG